MYSIKTMTRENVMNLGFKPEPHTVSLKDKGIWYCLCKDDEILSLLCIRKQRNELYIGEVYTPPKHRRKGYFTVLTKYVVDKIYPNYSVSVHCLEASKRGFEKAGFKQYTFREFKHGNQWWLRREGEKYEGKQIYN